MKEVTELLENYAKSLMETGDILLLIQLYRKAKRYGDAAILLHKVRQYDLIIILLLFIIHCFQIAKIADKKKLSPMKVKKLHVLSAYMVKMAATLSV